MRAWPLLVLLAVAVAAAAWLFLQEEGSGGGGGALDREEEGWAPGELRGSGDPGSLRDRTTAGPTPDEAAAAKRAAEAERGAAVLLEGRVLDAASGEPLKAKLWLAGHVEPCPRLLAAPLDELTFLSAAGTLTDAEGRFAISQPRGFAAAPGDLDLFVAAKGYVAQVLCAPAGRGPHEIRLERGLELKGRVRGYAERPVVGAVVRARPAPETPAVPGHATILDAPRTNEEGRFVLDGLLPGRVVVEVDHPRHMPLTSAPVDPKTSGPLELQLVPALLATFLIRTDDGREPEHPTLVWSSTGPTPRQDVLLLPYAPPVPAGEEALRTEGVVTAGPVLLPCDARSVVLQVRADGYATWQSEPLRLPPEGGEQTFEVTLVGDLTTGSIALALEDDTGAPVAFVSTGADVAIARLEPGTSPSAYVVEQQEKLRVTALPAGRYRIELRARSFAPAAADVVVTPGQETEALVRLRPPAKVLVRFQGGDGRLMRFELRDGTGRVPNYPEGAYERRTDPDTGEPIVVAGADGMLLAGLAAGTYSVVVVDEAFQAAPTVVHLKEGDTEEVEIYVRPR